MAQRLQRERTIAARMVAALLVLLCGLSLLAPSKSTIYQLLVFVPAALWCLQIGSLRLLPDAEADTTPARPTHWVVLSSYAVSAAPAAILSFATWHKTSARDFTGIAEGGGSYALLFALVLAFVILGLLWRQTKQPFDTALHVVALASGTIFIGAAFAGTASRGLSTVRVGVLVAGILTVIAALAVLRQRSTDALSQQGYFAAVFSCGGALMMASSFMSWGGGSFVNYWPGTSIGGFDGRVTMWAGAGITTAWIAHFVVGRDDESRWPNMVRLTAILGFAGLAGVLAGAIGTAQPARALAAAACMWVLVSVADVGRSLPSGRPIVETEPSRASVLVTRAIAGSLALLGALLALAAGAYLSQMRFSRNRSEIDYDDLVAALSFGALGFALLRGAVGSTRGRRLSAHAAAMILGGLTLIFLIPPDRISGHGLILAAVFTAVAVFAIVAPRSDDATDPDLAGRVWTAVRSHWLPALAAAVATHAVLEWVLPLLLSDPTLADDPTTEQRVAYFSAWIRILAARLSIAIAVLAMLTARGRNLRFNVAVTALSAFLYFVYWSAISEINFGADDEAWIVQASLSAAAVLFFCLGRGRFSLVAFAVVIGVVNTWGLDGLLRSVPEGAFDVPVLREVLLRAPSVVHYFAIAIV